MWKCGYVRNAPFPSPLLSLCPGLAFKSSTRCVCGGRGDRWNKYYDMLIVIEAGDVKGGKKQLDNKKDSEFSAVQYERKITVWINNSIYNRKP